MADPKETPQEQEARWTTQRTARDQEQQALQGSAETTHRENLGDHGRDRAHRCRGGCAHPAVTRGARKKTDSVAAVRKHQPCHPLGWRGW
jgi:hypothetical protein